MVFSEQITSLQFQSYATDCNPVLLSLFVTPSRSSKKLGSSQWVFKKWTFDFEIISDIHKNCKDSTEYLCTSHPVSLNMIILCITLLYLSEVKKYHWYTRLTKLWALFIVTIFPLMFFFFSKIQFATLHCI
jgi:hypothetical protein